MTQKEERLFNYYKKEESSDWILDKVEINQKEHNVKVYWIHNNDFLHTPHRVTFEHTLYTLPEDYDKARSMIEVYKESTERTCYDCGVSSTVFAMNSKLFIMIKDGMVIKSE